MPTSAPAGDNSQDVCPLAFWYEPYGQTMHKCEPPTDRRASTTNSKIDKLINDFKSVRLSEIIEQGSNKIHESKKHMSHHVLLTILSCLYGWHEQVTDNI
eukprot:4556129-Amphidinium_carterae.1